LLDFILKDIKLSLSILIIRRHGMDKLATVAIPLELNNKLREVCKSKGMVIRFVVEKLITDYIAAETKVMK